MRTQEWFVVISEETVRNTNGHYDHKAMLETVERDISSVRRYIVSAQIGRKDNRFYVYCWSYSGSLYLLSTSGGFDDLFTALNYGRGEHPEHRTPLLRALREICSREESQPDPDETMELTAEPPRESA